MRKSLKRITAVGVSMAMAVSMLVFSDPSIGLSNVMAAEQANEGALSDTAFWRLDSEGVLTIYGTGDISDGSIFQDYDIKKLVVESGITSIESDMFRDNVMLENVILPDTLTDLGDYAFEGCISLKSIEISENNHYFTSTDGVLYDKDMETLMIYPAARESENYAIPQGVIETKDYAFDYVNRLKTITIPASLKSFGEYVPFYKSTSIISFQVDAENAYFSSIGGRLYTKDGKKMVRYAMGSDKNSININDLTEIIADEAFSGASALTDIVFGPNVKTIGEGVLNDCTNLTSITISNPDCEVGELIQKELSDYNSNVVFYGYEDSTTAKFAKEYGWKFEAVKEGEVASISVNTLPKKLTFALNDKFNNVGLEILIQYKDGSELVRSSGFTIDGYDATKLGTQEITINYKGATAQYSIEVVEQLEYQTAKMGERTQIDIIEENQIYYLYFTPNLSGIYDFYAMSNSDTYGAIYDTDGNLLAENDDLGDMPNGDYVVDFWVSHNLEAGKKYLLAAKYQSEDELGSFDVIIEKHKDEGEEKTYTVTLDGEQVMTAKEGETYTLPRTARVGYYADGKMYKKGSTYTITKDINFSSVDLTVNTGASIRLSEPSGLTFKAAITCSDSSMFESGAIVNEGMLITTNDLYSEEGSLDFASEYTYVNIENSGWSGNVAGAFTGSIAGIRSMNYGRTYIGRAYVTVKFVDGSESVIYSKMTGVRSVRSVATSMKNTASVYDSMTPAQKALIDKFVAE